MVVLLLGSLATATWAALNDRQSTLDNRPSANDNSQDTGSQISGSIQYGTPPLQSIPARLGERDLVGRPFALVPAIPGEISPGPSGRMILLACQQAKAEWEVRKAELEEAEASLDAALAKFEQPIHLETPLADINVQLEEVEARIESAPNAIRAAEAQLELTEDTCERKSKLKGVIPIKDISQARQDCINAQVALDQERSLLELLLRQRDALRAKRDVLRKRLDLKLDETNAQVVARAKVKSAQARVNLAEMQMEHLRFCLDCLSVPEPELVDESRRH